MKYPAIAGIVYLLIWNLPSPVKAQPVPTNPVLPEDTPDPEDTLIEPVIPEEPPNLLPEESPVLPPTDPRQPSPVSPEAGEGQRFRVGSIELLGVTLEADELGQLTALVAGEAVSVLDRIAAIAGQEVTLEDLFALRAFITDAYVNAGYVTSGAFLPEQTFADGSIVRIQVVEGTLEALEINGLTRLQESYVRDRIQLRAGRPLRQQDLEEALQLLQLDPLIDRIEAQLLTGSGPGRSILSLRIEEAPPLAVGLSINNYRSPSIGTEQITPSLSYSNLLGLGDRVDFNASFTRGLQSYNVDYTIPITPQDGTFNFGFSTSDSLIIEDEFESLGIRSDTRTFSFRVRQPLVRTPSQEFAVGLGFDLRQSQTFLFDDMPFSFSEGPEDGESRVSAVRFFQDWVNRTPSQVLAARSQFSFGLGAFDATMNDIDIDGQFFSWLGQFQWVQRLPKNRLLVTRIATQFTPDTLLSLEQFSQGGVSTVRGYRDNELVTDNGVIGSVELRLPLSAQPEELQLTPFVEGGVGWNTGAASTSQGLASIGIGLRWQVDPNVRFRLDYGLPLIEPETDGDTLQENGISFSLDWAL